MRYERVLFWPAALIGTADGRPASGTLPQDKHARAGDSCEMHHAICNCCSPNTIKSSMLGVDISYIIRSSLYPLLLDTHPARPALGGLVHSMIQSPPHSVHIRPWCEAGQANAQNVAEPS